MHKITDEEIDFILKDIKANGVVIENLQHNLLDHICCIIENEKSEHEDFYEFYKKVVPRFFKKDLKEIQEETEVLLTFKNYYAMKNTLKISGITSALLIILGAILKLLHLPGAGFALALGGVLFSLLFLPLMIILKFKDEESKTDKWVFSIGFLIAMVITFGIIFKLGHWPYANILMFSGLTAFIFIYVPLYFIMRFRRPELRFNTIVNSVLMMACGGMLFALQNVGYSSKVDSDYTNYYEYIKSSNDNIVKANLNLYSKIDTNEMEVNLLREKTKSLFQLIDDIKADLTADIGENQKRKSINHRLLKNSDIKRHLCKLFFKSKNELSFEVLKSRVEEYNSFITKYATSEKQINITILSENMPFYDVLIDVLNQIQLQITNNENSLLNLWS
jgi:hypothetical protein